MRQITESRVRHFDFFGGWIIQIRTGNYRHWYMPMEETTYGVLDSEQYNVYPTEEAALARLGEILASEGKAEALQ